MIKSFAHYLVILKICVSFVTSKYCKGNMFDEVFS